jgi:hypothetical protein
LFNHFIYFVKSSADGHYSHTKNLDVVDKAREHSVAIVSLSPHSAHKMLSFDVGFMKPLKHIMYKKLKRG